MSEIGRRQFLVGAGALFAATLAGAQPARKPPIAAYVFGHDSASALAGPNPANLHARAFVHRLRDLGWEDGRNFVLERHSPGNSLELARAIFADLAARNVNVIYAAGTVGGTLAALEAMKATRAVPIVFAGSSDPVALGLVASLRKPGANVTGVTVAAGAEMTGKRIEFLKQIAPRIKKIAYFRGTAADTEMARSTAEQLGVELIVVDLERAEQLDTALATVTRERADALLFSGFGVFMALSARLLAFAGQHRLPTMFFFPELVEEGGLASYSIDFLDLNRRAADYVDRILRGTKPADLPVEQPKKFELVVNLKTARALGIVVPPSVLLQADRVIE